MLMGKWIDELLRSIKKTISLTTVDGLDRQGIITGFTNREILFNGKKVEVIIEVELNSDPMDRIPFDRIAKMDVY